MAPQPRTAEPAARLDALEQAVGQLREQLHQRAVTIPIATLAPEPFDLVRDIPVVVQPDEDSFTASFFDAHLHASGETQQDAVANLKDLLLALFHRLEKEPQLGKIPARQWAVLRSLIRRKP